MRRSSYASVLSGNAGSAAGARSGLPPNLSEGDSTSNSSPQPYGPPHPHHHGRNAPQSKSEGHIDMKARGNLFHWPLSALSGSDVTGTNTYEPWPDFFIPSYLRGSRHMERLQERQKAKSTAQKEGKLNRSTMGTLSRSSSGANLHKMVPSHRGMTHEIIERPFHRPQEEEPIAELPSRWSASDKWHGIEVAQDGSEAKFNGTAKQGFSDEGFAIRADRPMPKECGVYYFEVIVLSRGREWYK